MAARGDDAPLAQDDRGQEQSGVHDGAVHPPQHAPLPNYSITRTGSKVFKSGSLFLSSKGIGWTSWKKRWFILTSTSLVFFRSDPTAVPQKGSEVNLTLGGIDLNNSGRVVVKADKKLLTVLFPDGCDGRTFTLKAETLEDLCDWKDALEKALSQAPGAAIVMGQNEVFGNDHGGTVAGSLDQLKDKQVAKPTVIGRPILLALEDIDGTPSFLEKALQFVEEHGIKVEGILRQAADVDDVEHRIREYEQGNIEFSSAEDAHVVGDCIKYILRELPSSPVPASCCKALLEACRADRHVRVGAMRMAIYETFPEPNRRLLQRILVMMRTIASHKAVNRMSSSAVAACMAPLLLRPLLAGDCDLENEFNMGGDGSIQLMEAAAAANYAQAIVINLLEEYETIFGENAVMPDLYSDTEESGNASEDATDDDDDGSYEDDGDGYYTQDQDSESRSDDSLENEHIESPSGSCETETESKDFSHHGRTDGDDFQNIKRVNERFSLQSRPREAFVYFEDKQKPSSIVPRSIVTCDVSGSPSTEHNSSNPVNNIQSEYYHRSALNPDAVGKPVESSQFETAIDKNANKPTTIANEVIHSMRHPAALRHTPAKIYLSTESVDFGSDDVERLEAVKVSLQNKVTEEARENSVLLTELERQRKALREHRLSLQQDVAKLQEELRKERVLRKALETALKIPRGPLPKLNIDERVKADLEDLARTEAEVNKLKQKIDGLTKELYKEQEKNRNSHHASCIEFKQGEEVHETAVNKEADSKSISGSHVARRSISGKESNRIQTDYEGPQESTSNSNRHSNNLFDSLNYIQPKRSGKPSSSQAPEPHAGKSFPPTSSRRSVSRMQAADMTSTALTKLTSRLNFLKERRSQIANELQNISKSWSSMLATQIPDNGKASGGQSVASRKKKVNLDPGKSNKDV